MDLVLGGVMQNVQPHRGPLKFPHIHHLSPDGEETDIGFRFYGVAAHEQRSNTMNPKSMCICWWQCNSDSPDWLARKSTSMVW